MDSYFFQGNSARAPLFSSLVADHRCNLMGMEFVPEARVISHNKINLYGLMTLIKREELN
jgi:hypothetical protein